MEEKICRTCGQSKPLEEFSKTWRVRTKVPSHWCWHADCKECNTQRSLKWQKNNWEHVKAYRGTEDYKRYARNNWLVRIYHKTLDWYEEQFKAQNGCCIICGKPERCLGSGRKTKSALVVDHNHECCSGEKSCGECVRGLICDDCNHILGFAHDNPEILESAISYLKKYKAV